MNKLTDRVLWEELPASDGQRSEKKVTEIVKAANIRYPIAGIP